MHIAEQLQWREEDHSWFLSASMWMSMLINFVFLFYFFAVAAAV
jgi:hypothetical protein